MTARKFLRALVCVLTLAGMHAANAWTPPTDTAGPLTVSIEDFGTVTALEQQIPVTITLANGGTAPVAGTLRLGVTDQWRVVGENPRPFQVDAGKTVTVNAAVVAGRGSYAALYPVHAYADFTVDGKPQQAHAILITKIAREALGKASAGKPGVARVVALRAAQPLRMDGDLSDWTNAVPLPLGDAQASTGQVGAGDCTAVLMAAHDAQNLYLGLRVADDDISDDDTTSTDFMNSDYLRLYLSARSPLQHASDSLSTEDLVVAINPFGGPKPLVKVPDYGSTTRPVADGQITVVPRKTANGYDMEIAIPLALIRAGIRDDQELGFNLMLGDADGGKREGEITLGRQDGNYWLSPSCYTTLALSPRTEADSAMQLPLNTLSGRGVVRLDRLNTNQIQIAREGALLVTKPLGWVGSDPETGISFMTATASRKDTRACLNIHPPYRGGVGSFWSDARFSLPNIKPIRLTFATAIRDNTADEPVSDGVEWRVYVAEEGGEFQQVFQRFSAAKQWEPAEVDLSRYAGKQITLRLWNGPGPKNNTTCDSGYWAEPTLAVGSVTKPESPASLAARQRLAQQRAAQALAGKPGAFSWLLKNRAGTFGAGLALGPRGLVDGILAFSGKGGAVSFQGFTIAVAGEALDDWRANAIVSKVTVTGKAPLLVRHTVLLGTQRIPVEAKLWAQGGALRVAFSMPGVTRDKRGQPRFTNLAIGAANQKARRVYGGFGNVIENPEPFTLSAGGFQLSTRHVGMDFPNGISLVQASDIYPDRFVVDPARQLYSLQTHHDSTLTFVPSAQGAFAAARVYRDLAGFKPAGGVAKLKGKMCIDWWGRNNVGADIRRAGAYGLNDSLFLMHNWQRWGYDYRLPDIYPPRSDGDVWNDWISACKENGILAAVHDNYIDFYPDADGYSYKHMLFNEDGTPQLAWNNTGRQAQSYRWLPQAFQPWLERNLKMVKEGFAPTAYFIDVFSAIPLLDYYDQDGRFYTKKDCAKYWGKCFDTVRNTLGDNAPQLSEAGHDGLIGHLDGSQSDHNSAKAWGWKGSAADRVPWHDMASHGAFVLLAGGLGNRYAGDEPNANWDSDDYLTNTVIGGRNPMSSGPCTRGTVMTYWLLHDICKELANQSLETHTFVGDDIHRQHTTFGGGGQVWTNRGTTSWKVGDVVLPRFGFLARSGKTTAAILERDGLTVGFAHRPGVTFVDARPTSRDKSSQAPARTRVLSAKHLGNGQIECEIEWEVLAPVAKGAVTFVHLCHDKEQQGEKIAVHAGMDLDPALLQKPGTYVCKSRFAIPADSWDGEYKLRYGLYIPSDGGRLTPIADMDGTRVRGGIFTVKKQGGAIESITYAPENSEASARTNSEGKLVDFGAVVTNGAFRLLHSGSEWTLLPLQGSMPFHAELKLDRLDAAGKKVVRVEGFTQDGKSTGVVAFSQKGGAVVLDLDAEAFSYRLKLQ